MSQDAVDAMRMAFDTDRYQSFRDEMNRLYKAIPSSTFSRTVESKCVKKIPPPIDKPIGKKIYRFKTEEEFEKEFGEKWLNKIDWAHEMNEFFGQEISSEDYFEIQEIGKIRKNSGKVNGWTIKKNMVKKDVVLFNPIGEKEKLKIKPKQNSKKNGKTIKLSRVTASITAGQRPSGSRIRGRKKEIRIASMPIKDATISW